MSRAMKDSGIEWIGEIPKEWDYIRFKFLHEGMNTGEGIDKEFWTKNVNDRVFYTAGLEPIRTNYSDFPEWKYTQTNDILLARNGTPYVYLPVLQACYTDHIIRAKLKTGVNKKFIRYSLQQSISSEIVDQVSIATWSASLWNEQYIPWPSFEEQQRIISSLDTECSRIDAVIEKTRASIEEYKKMEQLVITQAVTKGIRPKRVMQESSIDWIGKYPSDWICEKVKYVAAISRGLFNHRPRNDERYYDGPYPFIQTGDVAQATKYITSYSQTLNELGKSVSKEFPKGTLTMTIAANVGDVAILGFDAYFPDSVVGFVPKEGIDGLYLYYIFSAMKEEFVRTAIKSTQLNLNIDRVKELFIPVTFDIHEQKEIVDYLEKKCSEIDELISKKKLIVNELEKYKKALIFEYVTGKKEVPA